jgi:arginyl-tRNA synthetase
MQMNIEKYLSNIFTSACKDAFKEFLPENFDAQVIWNSYETSDLTTSAAMKIFNMCKKNKDFKFKTQEEIAQEILKFLKDEKQIVGETKITNQIPTQKGKKKKEEKKDEKKEGEEKKEEEKKEGEEKKEEDKKDKKKKKEKVLPTMVYIDINLKKEYIEELSNSILASNEIKINTIYSGHHVGVDFSSPNIAKEMHVGHLRSTILGETICRILEFIGNKVERINHVGDWGTQFGMLIAHLEEVNPNYTENPEAGTDNIRDLEEFYKNAKKSFDESPEFKKKAQLKTVDLQKGDPATRKAWQFICQVSRENFEKIYKRLDIHTYEKGESFYDPLCRKLVPELEEKKLCILDEGAKIFRIPNEKLPLILVKSDGGIGYDTTDLAAIEYRINELKCDWIIYVVGGEQKEHFKLLFKAAEICGWADPKKIRLDHMDFGLVLDSKGKKFATRKGGNVKLGDVLDEAWEDAEKEMKNRNEKNKMGLSDEYIHSAAEKLGYSSIKYFDFKQFRSTNYKYDSKKMLDDKGNTAVYLFYMYVRILSIFRKNNLSQEDIDKLIKTEKIVLTEKSEINLLVQILKFNDVIDAVLKDLAINLLCDYLYGIAVKFANFYEDKNCKISGNNSRILLIELCRRFMKQTFDLLNMTPIEKI